MSISSEQSVTSQRSVQECVRAVVETMQDLGMNPRVYGDRVVVGSRGSSAGLFWMMVAFGLASLLAHWRTFPVRVQVDVEDQGTERRLRIVAEEAFTMGMRKRRSEIITAEEALLRPVATGYKGKMKKAVEGAVQQVAQGSMQRLGEGVRAS